MIDARPLYFRRLQLHRSAGVELIPGLLPGVHRFFGLIQGDAGTLLQLLRLIEGMLVLAERLTQLVDQTTVGGQVRLHLIPGLFHLL